MRAGSLRKVGWVQQRAAARDSFGGVPSSWSDVEKIRYSIETTSAREMDSAGNVRAVAISTITMRYRPEIVPGMRIRSEPNNFEDARYFNITAVQDVAERHHQLELTVIEDRTAKP